MGNVDDSKFKLWNTDVDICVCQVLKIVYSKPTSEEPKRLVELQNGKSSKFATFKTAPVLITKCKYATRFSCLNE